MKNAGSTASTESLLGFAILGMLHARPQSGYDLRKAFVATPMRLFSDSPGAIYPALRRDRKSTRLNSSHQIISYAVFCLKKKNNTHIHTSRTDYRARRTSAH